MHNPLLDMLEKTHPENSTVLSTPVGQYTASDLASMADRLEAEMRKQSISLVALYADNGPAWVVADLVCQRLAICLVPLPTFFSPLQIRATLARCNAAWLLTDNADALHALVESRLLPEHEASGLQLCRLNCDAGNAPAIPQGTGKITFTSGSTGDAKGVCLGNEQLLRQASALREAVALDHPRHLCLLPLSTLLENVAGVYAPLLAGGEVIVPSLHELGYEGSRLARPQQLLNTISKAAPQTLILIPDLLKLLVASVHSGWQPPPSLRFLAVGGSKVGTALLQEAWSLGLPVYEGYGLSECASVVSLNTPAENQPGSCGKLLPHLGVENRDGELVVSGNAMPYCVALISSRDPGLDDAAIQAWLDQVNAQLPDYAQVKAWHRLTQPLAALPGLLASNGRPTREVIAQKFATELADVYDSGNCSSSNSSTLASAETDKTLTR